MTMLSCLLLLLALYPLSTYSLLRHTTHRRIKRNKHWKDSTISTKQHLSQLSNTASDSCIELYYTQTLDHFGSGIGPSSTQTDAAVLDFQQRYFICNEDAWKANDPIFFYAGNEAAVTVYIEYTGLMWELSPTYNALLVFAEHRYYGESLPYSQNEILSDNDKLQYLTVDQTLADYSSLISYLKQTKLTSDSAVIAFGGSYGGMLAAWMRMKYPQLIDGAIAGSAPILGVYGLTPAADAYSFAVIETYDASVDGGVINDWCAKNIALGWDSISAYAKSIAGRYQLKKVFNLCSAPSTQSSAEEVADVIEEAIAYMAMSSYPYASDYITSAVLGSNAGKLPAYPLRSACNEYLAIEFNNDYLRLVGIASLNAVFWNVDGSDSCIDMDSLWSSYDDYLWDFIYCRSLLILDGMKGEPDDMFWESEWDASETIEWCNEEFDINVDINGPAAVKYGGRNLYKSMSNIVFSNGELDPWMPTGVFVDDVGGSHSLVTIMIDDAGHHLDLMFSDENDMQSVIDARNIESENIAKWIGEVNSQNAVGMCDRTNYDVEWVVQFRPWLTGMTMLL